MQQYRVLNAKDNSNIDPRSQFIVDLIEDVTREKAMNGFVLIAGDFNEDMEDGNSDGILKLMESCSLKNIFHELKGHCPSTRNNKRAIDHFFISEEVLHLVNQAGFLPDESSFTSDHAGLFIDISPQILQCLNQPIVPPKQRKLKLYNRPKVQQYVTYVLEQFDAHNIVNRMKNILQNVTSNGFTESIGRDLNKLDEQVTEIMLRSEAHLSPDDTPYAYSEELDRQMRIVRLIKKLQPHAKNNFPLETYVNSDLEDVAAELLFMSQDQINETLLEQRTRLRDMQDRSWEIRTDHQTKIRERAAEEQRKDVETIVKEMKQREIQSRMFVRIGNTLKTVNYAQITRLGLPKHIRSESTEQIWNYIQSTPDAELKSIE